MISIVRVGSNITLSDIKNFDKLMEIVEWGVRSTNCAWAESFGAAEAVRSILCTIDNYNELNTILNFFGLGFSANNRRFTYVSLSDAGRENMLEKIPENYRHIFKICISDPDMNKIWKKIGEIGDFSIRCRESLKILNALGAF
jgi:hypothetical protein